MKINYKEFYNDSFNFFFFFYKTYIKNLKISKELKDLQSTNGKWSSTTKMIRSPLSEPHTVWSRGIFGPWKRVKMALEELFLIKQYWYPSLFRRLELQIYLFCITPKNPESARRKSTTKWLKLRWVAVVSHVHVLQKTICCS